MKHTVKSGVISGTGLVLAVSLFIATIILANTTLTTWRIDLTQNKLFTLSNGTINILNNLEEPIQLDFYFSQKSSRLDFWFGAGSPVGDHPPPSPISTQIRTELTTD